MDAGFRGRRGEISCSGVVAEERIQFSFKHTVVYNVSKNYLKSIDLESRSIDLKSID